MKILRAAFLPLLLCAWNSVAQEHPNVERGLLPEKSYELSDVDTVNLFNGNVNITLPLGVRYPVNAMSYQFRLSYAVNSWEVGEREENFYFPGPPHKQTVYYHWSFPARRTNAGFGWMLTLGHLFRADSGLWTYLSPDGAQHAFYDTLHANNPAETLQGNESTPPWIRYTRDGSYLRLTGLASSLKVDFPDGSTHTFNKTDGRLTRMEDALGNYVTIDYTTQASGDPYPGRTKWTISDSTGRSHYVYFRHGPSYEELIWNDPESHEIAAKLDLAAFGGERAVYVFRYDGDPISGPPSVALSRRCPHTETSLSQTVGVAMLQAIDLPADGLEYRFVYDRGSQQYCSQLFDDGSGTASGNITRVVLPTGAEVRYKYRTYTYPAASLLDPNARSFTDVPGIASRAVYDRDGVTKLSETQYTPERYNAAYPEISQRRRVDRKNGDATVSRVYHYFSTCSVVSCGTRSEYGLPFSRAETQGPPYLSTETFTPNASGDLVRSESSYVTYEGDGNLAAERAVATDLNRRLKYSKTVYADDSTYADISYSGFDGLGRYRTAVYGGNFTHGTNARTTFTNYNPSRGTFNVSEDGTYYGTFVMPAGTEDWLFATFDRQQVTENGVTSTTRTCFDDDGFLTARRTYASYGTEPQRAANDLLQSFVRGPFGNIASERYLGGDEAVDGDPSFVGAPVNEDCPQTLAGERYRIDHAYSSGVRKSSWFVEAGTRLSHYVLDTEIDANTGLAASHTEARAVDSGGTTIANGLTTNLLYDLLGALTSETPAGTNRGASRSYAFGPQIATVEISEKSASGALLRKRTVSLDALGRATAETRSIPASLTATRTWTRDMAGRLITASAWRKSTDPEVLTHFSWDGLDRLLSRTSADGSVISFTYTGAHKSTRSSLVRTGGTATTLTQSTATTTSYFDRFGRLVQLTEPAGVKTGYSYDLGNRLTKVCANETTSCGQTRRFTYDNRGFLTEETSPELGTAGNGSALYRYDARGNVIRRWTGAELGPFDVRTLYDAAARPVRIHETRLTDGVQRTLKSFEYGSTNGTSDYRTGRLKSATRYNWFSDLAVQVIEDHVYGGRDGRLSSRVTYDYECSGTAATCNPWKSGTQKRRFEQAFAYDELGAVSSQDYPACTHAPCAGVLPARSVTNAYDAGFLSSVSWTSAPREASISYHASGMVAQIIHANQVTDSILLSPDGMPRPHLLTTTGAVDAASCVAPTFTAQPQSQTVAEDTPVTLTAPASGQTGAQIHYQWYAGFAPDRTTPVGTDSAQYDVVATSAASYWVEATNSCGSTVSETAMITVCAAPTLFSQALPADDRITRGQPVTLSVAPDGSPDVQWYVVTGSTTTPIAGATSATLRVWPEITTSYRAIVTNDCDSAETRTAVITVDGPATIPANVAVTTNGTRNTVTWQPSTSTTEIGYYQVRRHDGSLFTVVSGLALIDGPAGLSPGNAYGYSVRAVDTNQAASEWSALKFTVTTSYTGHPLQPGMPLESIHVRELREAIDALRSVAGLGHAWTVDEPPNGTIVRAADVHELQERLNETRRALGLPDVVFSEPALAPEDLIRAIQFNELRSGLP